MSVGTHIVVSAVLLIAFSGLAVAPMPFNRLLLHMKRKELLRWLRENGATLIREGGRHSIWGKDSLKTQIPRHREIVDLLARKICKDLDIPPK